MQLHSFCLFVFVCCLDCPLISLALKYFQIKVIFYPTIKSIVGAIFKQSSVGAVEENRLKSTDLSDAQVLTETSCGLL